MEYHHKMTIEKYKNPLLITLASILTIIVDRAFANVDMHFILQKLLSGFLSILKTDNGVIAEPTPLLFIEKYALIIMSIMIISMCCYASFDEFNKRKNKVISLFSPAIVSLSLLLVLLNIRMIWWAA